MAKTYAVLPPVAAYVLMREQAQALAALEAKGRRMLLAGQVEPGRQVLEGIEQIRQSARAFAADRASEHPAQADGGTSEVPAPSADAESCRPPPGTGLTTGQAAERFRAAGHSVSERTIRYMVTGARGPIRLSAVWVKGRHLIDDVSVQMEIERRSKA